MNDFNEECKNCWCYSCKLNVTIGGECENCDKCSGDNSDNKYKYVNNKWKMNCKKYLEDENKKYFI